MKPNSIKLSFASILLTIGIASCTSEEAASSDNKVAVNISSGVTTRAVDTAWEKGDLIGVTMIKSQDDATVVASYRNNPYIVSEQDSYEPKGKEDFNPVGAENIMYFPVDGSTVSFKSYYPYDSKLPETMIMPLSVADQTSLAAIDLMTATHEAGFSKNDPNVHLRFHHRLCKVIFKLTAEDGSGIDLTGCSLVIKGMKTTGSYDLMGDALTVNDESVANISVPVSGTTATGIVLPRELGEGVTFEITTADGSVYTATLPTDVPFESGKANTLNIALKRTECTITADIEDWVGGPEKDMEAVHIVIADGGAITGFENGDDFKFYQIADNKVASSNNGTVVGTDQNKAIDLDTPWDVDNLLGSHITAVFPKDASDVAAGQDAFEWTAFNTTTSTSNSDVLTATSPEISQGTSGSIPLTFGHALSKVTVNILAGEGFMAADLASVTVVLNNLFLKGTISVADGKATASTSPDDKVASFTPQKLQPTSGAPANVAASYEALVMPQTVASATTLVTATYNGTDYASTVAGLSIAGDLVLTAGQNHTIDITFKKIGINFSASVTDWTAGTSGSTTID